MSLPRCDYAHDAPLAMLSRDCEVITCIAEEHVMFSGALAWNDGRLVWSVEHDAEKRLQHLDAHGNLPEIFTVVRKRFSGEQSLKGDADYLFDVPVEVRESDHGFPS